MSKAFTKDEGEGSSEPLAGPLGVALPPGARNYVTAAGAEALRQRQREALTEADRRRAAGDGAGLAIAQERLAFLAERLELMEVVSPPQGPGSDLEPIRFGAVVETEDETGRRRTFHLVGVDEADPARGAVGWTSPIARALLGRSAGDEVTLRTPQGETVLEILAVSYRA